MKSNYYLICLWRMNSFWNGWEIWNVVSFTLEDHSSVNSGLGNNPFGRILSLVSILKPMNILVIEISVLIRLNNSSFPIWIWKWISFITENGFLLIKNFFSITKLEAYHSSEYLQSPQFFHIFSDIVTPELLWYSNHIYFFRTLGGYTKGQRNFLNIKPINHNF